jgi:hypothetical protein
LISNTLAPGARVLIRDAEWIVKRVDRTGTGGRSVEAVGVSEIVRDKEARFLTEIEGDSITVLDPADTQLVTDSSPQFRGTKLYLESLLRQSPPTGSDLWIGHRAAIDDLSFQLEPALLALDQPRQRILIADAVGLGKTIEVGILLAELIKRGKGKRILVVTTKSMMTQFQKELWSRFTIPLVRLDSVGLERVRSRIPTNANPFHYYDRTIISIDTLKQNAEFRVWADKSYWDVIVIDEAHNVAFRGSKLSLRARLADLLSRCSDTLIMASATPHDGKAASFASLMNMLNPTAIADPENYGPKDIKGLFLRRYKKHVQEQIGGSFLERKVSKHHVPASAKEERIYDLLADAEFASFDKARRSGQLLFKTVLEKALFSSPAAALATVRQRQRKLEKNSSADAFQDHQTLEDLAKTLEEIGPDDFAKYRQLVELLRPGGYLEWNPNNPADRIVLFTERIETLRFLEVHLDRDLDLKPGQISVVHGSGVDDIDLQEKIEEFGRDKAPVRLLLASDIASEGLNLHFLCHKLIHFDIPWSLMVFQQRNGRIDRYGQERMPHIAYLYTEPRHSKIRGDLRILELLIEKDEQAAKNIGDPSVFLNVFDAVEEEKLTGAAMEDSLAPEEFNSRMEQAAEEDLLDILFGDEPPPSGKSAHDRTHTLPSLFPSDFAYVSQGLEALHPAVDLQTARDPDRELITVTANQDLRRVFRALPDDAVPEDGRIHLTTDRKRVKQAIAACRAEERQWPDVHLLWDLHPIMDWLNFKLTVKFSRKEAPLVRLAGVLGERESLFLVQGEIPNRKGQPVVHQWFAVHFEGQVFKGILSLEAFLDKTQFHDVAHPNPGEFEIVPAVKSLLPQAVEEARKHMSLRQEEFQTGIIGKLSEETESLKGLKSRQLSFLEIEYPDDEALIGSRLNKKRDRQRRIDQIFDDYRRWVTDTLSTEDSPFLRVAGVFIG